MKFNTKTVHAGVFPDPTTGAIMTPIYQTSTYAQSSPGDHKGFVYSRTHNPTRSQLQDSLASLENATHGLSFASGLAAVDAVLRLLSPGDEVISTNDLYGGSYRIFTQVYKAMGIKFHFVDMSDLDAIHSHVNEHTKLIWIETPTNPLLKVVDIKEVCEVAKSKGILTCVDNTFASPYLQNPIELGADIVMHSVTKYINGHSDVIMGALVCDRDDLHQKLAFIQNSCGSVPGPQDCFLVLRGIKTLHLRMQRHCDNGRQIAEYLVNHPKVSKVYWPGFKTHPNYEVAKSQMKDFGGMMSFTLVGDNLDEALQVISNTKIFALAESLGGVESLCGHPATMTHAAVPKEERLKAGLKDSLIRLSIGIEDVEDLIEDLKQAIG